MAQGFRAVLAQLPGTGSGRKRRQGLVRGAVGLLSAVGIAGSALVVAASAAPAGAAGPSTPSITNFPRQALSPHFGIRETWAASNWSGYAETGTYTGVSATWTVPTVAASSSATYSSAWIGVDGFNNSDLIQTGTEEDYYNGSAHYNAWWEILPASETALPTSYPIGAGDRMSASIYETSSTVSTGFFFRRTTEHVWDITISDTTRGWSYTTKQGYNGPGTSAEWVVEAPEVGNKIATLAHYTITPPSGIGDFDNAGILSAVVSAGPPTYAGANLNYQNDSGVMIQNGAQVSTPGDPDVPLSAFNAAYGSALPATPAG
jgi:Peptidase A4 family